MAAPPTPGLSPADLDQIREALAGGRKPKVVFTDAAGQIAGQAGHVVELTDPDDSDEWIVVQFGKDELPFSPTDLAVPIRGALKPGGGKAPVKAGARSAPTTVPARAGAGRRTTTAAATPAAKAEPELKLGTPPTPAPRSAPREGKSMLTTGAPTGETAIGAQPAQSRAGQPSATQSDAPQSNAGKSSAAQNGAAQKGAAQNSAAQNSAAQNSAAQNSAAQNGGAARPAKAAKAKPPASLVVTLQYAEKEWTVAAVQGSKSLAKPYVIKPTDALRMVALIDVPGVHEAVEAIIAAERAEAEGRANRLREELAELESRLAELSQG